jgi:hypothetical protein
VKQSIRDVVTGELSLEYFAKRFGEGWKIASIEWVRESADAGVAVDAPHVLNDQAALPYGLQVTQGGLVQENPLEATALLLILEQIIREKRIQEIATELNRQGYVTRSGTAWSPTDVFELLPRLIEAGPSLLRSAAWRERSPTAQRISTKTN